MNWFAFMAVIWTIWWPDFSAAMSRRSERDHTAMEKMINEQIRSRGIKDSRVLRAIESTPRHLFVPKDLQDQAYSDQALPIGFAQTISQPYIVAFMSEAADISASDRVLEIGTGSGYQGAILSLMAKEVYSIEILQSLSLAAQERFRRLDLKNILCRVGDGYVGWPEAAPFDVILVTAAPNHIPQALKDQLKEGGRLIIPVGESFQKLLRITKIKSDDGKWQYKEENLLPVRFVPMTGEAQNAPR